MLCFLVPLPSVARAVRGRDGTSTMELSVFKLAYVAFFRLGQDNDSLPVGHPILMSLTLIWKDDITMRATE